MPTLAHSVLPFDCSLCGVVVTSAKPDRGAKPHLRRRLCGPCKDRVKYAERTGRSVEQLRKRLPNGHPDVPPKRKGLPPIGSQLTCPTCGDVFPKREANQRYCSMRCGQKAAYARTPSESAVCDWCGHYYQRSGDHKRGNFSACSKSCVAAYMTCVVRGLASREWPRTQPCIDCGSPYPTKSSMPSRCPDCRNSDREKACTDCGVTFTARPSLKRCAACRESRRERWKRDKGNRHLVHRAYIIKRDKGRCQACRCRVIIGKPLHPRAAEIDHIVPKSLWPEGVPGRDAPANLRLLCRACNAVKSNGTAPGGDQLLLIG